MGELVGRAASIDAVTAALETGGTVLVTGPAGIGRSSVLAAAGAALTDAVVVDAGSGPTGRDIAMGTVRRLLSRLRRARPDLFLQGPGERAAVALDGGVGEVDPFGVADAIGELLAQVAEEDLVVLVVDDIHLADEASLRVLVGVTSETTTGMALLTSAPQLGDAPTGLDWSHVEELRPLVADEIAVMAGRALGASCEAAFIDALTTVTAGLPDLVGPLLTAVKEQGRGGPGDVGENLADLVVPIVPARVTARLTHLGTDARAVALAASVLGPGARVDVLAAATTRPVAVVSDALAELIDAGLFCGGGRPAWTSSLLGAATRRLVGGGEAALMAGRAAAAMAQAGDPVEEVGALLLDALPVGEAWAADALRAAAAAASARGAPEVAGDLWARLLDEPLEAEDRAWAEAGRARTELQLGDPAGIDRLRDLAPRIPDAGLRGWARFATGRALLWDGRGEAAAEEFAAAAAEVALVDPVLVRRAEAGGVLALAIAAAPQATAAVLAGGATGDAPVPEAAEGDASMAGARAIVASLAGEPATVVHRLASACVADERLLSGPTSDNTAVGAAATALAAAGDPEAALRALEVPLSAAREAGAASTVATLGCVRAVALLATGRVAEAGVAAGECLASPGLYPVERPAALAVVIDAATATGRPDEAIAAREDLARWADQDRGDPLRLAHLRASAAVAGLALHDGELDGAVAIADRLARSGVAPGLLGAEETAVRALLRLGRRADARRRSGDLLGAEAWQSASRRGRATVLAGLATGDLDQVEEGATTVLEGTDRLAAARSQVELGRARSRAGRRVAAREAFRVALDIASAIEAEAVADEAIAGLRQAGGRLRARALVGMASLTPSEERVVRLVASGHGNRAVADALHLSRKTVEFHLGNAYAKLGTNRRDDLPALVAGHDGPS